MIMDRINQPIKRLEIERPSFPSANSISCVGDFNVLNPSPREAWGSGSLRKIKIQRTDLLTHDTYFCNICFIFYEISDSNNVLQHYFLGKVRMIKYFEYYGKVMLINYSRCLNERRENRGTPFPRPC